MVVVDGDRSLQRGRKGRGEDSVDEAQVFLVFAECGCDGGNELSEDESRVVCEDAESAAEVFSARVQLCRAHVEKQLRIIKGNPGLVFESPYYYFVVLLKAPLRLLDKADAGVMPPRRKTSVVQREGQWIGPQASGPMGPLELEERISDLFGSADAS